MKKVLIIGAGFLQDFVIRKARSMGYYTLAVDANRHASGFAHADEYAAIDIVDERACLEYAMEKGINGVLTAATDYGVLTASYIAEQMQLPGLHYQAAQRVKNKYLVRKCLYENQVDDTAQAYEVTSQTDLQALGERLAYPVMVKPCDGSGSRGTSRMDGPEELAAACRHAMASSITRRAEIESFITGQEYGAESLVINGEIHVLAVMKKWMTSPPYYAELGHAIPCGLDAALEKRIRSCVERAIHALQINHGSVNMDLLVTDKGTVHIVDIGARMGGNLIGSHIVPLGTGIDYLGNMLRAAVGDPVCLEPSLSERAASVVTRLLAFPGGTIRRLPDISRLEQELDVEICHHMQIGDLVGKYRTNLDGVGYVVAKAESVEAAFRKAERARRQLEEMIFEESLV